MALTSTTAASAVAASDTKVKLTSATGIATKMWLKVDQEVMRVTDVSLSPTIGVVRGYAGSAATPHSILAPAVFGVLTDFVQGIAINPQVEVVSQSIGADGAVTGPGGAGTVPVADTIVYINKATAIAATIALPSADQSNTITFISTTAAAHVVTMTGNPAANDVATFTAAIGSSFTIKAQPGAWGILATGNVTVA